MFFKKKPQQGIHIELSLENLNQLKRKLGSIDELEGIKAQIRNLENNYMNLRNLFTEISADMEWLKDNCKVSATINEIKSRRK